jgi:hypothetical protein
VVWWANWGFKGEFTGNEVPDMRSLNFQAAPAVFNKMKLNRKGRILCRSQMILRRQEPLRVILLEKPLREEDCTW